MQGPSAIAFSHYQAGHSGQDVDPVLSGLDDSDTALNPDALAALDQFHAGGLPATLRLADLLKIGHGADVLDAGSGMGGPSRAIASAYECHVTGVDLTPRYVSIARELARRMGLEANVSYEVGDLLNLNFQDARFDAAYSQHVAMNIADRAGLYREIRRVLKPGAAFAFHDVIAADSAESPIYPTPWAADAGSSFLLDKSATFTVLADAGLAIEVWTDVTEASAAAIAQLNLADAKGPTLASVMGPRFSMMADNFGRNLREARLRLVMGRARAV